MTQTEDEHGRPVYDLPAGLRYISRKEYVSGEPPTGLPAWLELRIAWPEQGATAMDMLRQNLQGISPQEILRPPTESKLGDKVWAVAEYRATMPSTKWRSFSDAKAVLPGA